MDMQQTIQSPYLKSQDITGSEPGIGPTVFMLRVEMKKFGDDDKPVLYVDRYPKGIVLNVTNRKVLIARYGKESNDWAGKPIQLYTEMANNPQGGPLVLGIRVRIPGPRLLSVHQPTAPSHSAIEDSELPQHQPTAPSHSAIQDSELRQRYTEQIRTIAESLGDAAKLIWARLPFPRQNSLDQFTDNELCAIKDKLQDLQSNAVPF